MTGKNTSGWQGGRIACAVALLCLAIGSTGAIAQEQQRPRQPQAREEPGLLDRVGNWFDRQFGTAKSSLEGASVEVDNFNREAGIAARTTAAAAKDAADAVARLPKARLMSGHAKCAIAPNGAADCAAAAASICRAKGFESGTSADTTVAETCPPRVLLSGREPQPGECRTDTFVNRALCQ